MNYSNVKNIIFDFGGIFLDVQYQKTEAAFVAAGVQNFAALYSQFNANHLFEALETGQINEAAFYEAFRQLTQTTLSNQTIQTCWNAMLGHYYTDVINWLPRVAQQYNIYLYSNTNQIHYNYFHQLFSQQFHGTNFNHFFRKAYYSHTLGLRKPYKDGFLKIIEEQHLIPSQTLFIDDTYKNLIGAQEAGLQVAHVVPPQKVTSLDL